jgi:phenylalanyl-tRNA synthetase beta chain
MKVPIGWLRDLVAFTEPVAELAERLSVAGLEVERIEDLPDGEVALELDVLPNMARCMSMVGVAREVAAVTGAELRVDLELAPLPSPSPELAPRILEPAVCSRFLVAVIDDVEAGEAPAWLRRRLGDMGVESVDGLVDVANYVMFEVGQPLHVYDLERLPSPHLGVRRSRADEELLLLSQRKDAQAASLPAGIPVIVGSDDTPVAVAGIVGGRPTAVGTSTRSIMVEAASFDFIEIRRAQSALGLQTEASARFSRGVDPQLVTTAVGRFCELVGEISTAFRVRAVGESGVTEARRRTIRLDIEDLSRTVGATYTPEEVESVFARLGLAARREGDVFWVTVGDERADLQIPNDLMEEVVRIDGLGRLPATMPEDPIVPPRRDSVREGHLAIRDAMVRAGFTEVITYTLTSPSVHAALGGPDAELLPLLNPLSSDLTVLRRTLLPGLLTTLESTLRHTASAHLFEHGVVVLPEAQGIDPGLPREAQRVALAMTGPVEPQPLWTETSRPVDFFDATDAVQGLMRALHIDGVRLVAAETSPYLPSVCAAVAHGDEILGHVGMVREDVAERFGVQGRQVFAGEFDADALVRLRQLEFKVSEPSRFPSVHLDLSVAVPAEVPVGDIVAAASQAGGTALEELSVFDVFSGSGVPESHKAVGLRLTINIGDRTLTTREAESVRERIVERLHDEFSAEPR